MTKSIKDFLPKNTNRKHTVQALVDADLVVEIKKLMAKHKLSWAEVLTACFKKMKEEMTS